MTCVAGWKEGNKRYFVASVNSKNSQWAEQKDRYQCFLYEDISNNMKMSQGQFSGSCQGEIFSSHVSNIFYLIFFLFQDSGRCWREAEHFLCRNVGMTFDRLLHLNILTFQCRLVTSVLCQHLSVNTSAGGLSTISSASSWTRTTPASASSSLGHCWSRSRATLTWRLMLTMSRWLLMFNLDGEFSQTRLNWNYRVYFASIFLELGKSFLHKTFSGLH